MLLFVLFSLSLIMILKARAADQFEYEVINSAGDVWIVNMQHRTCTCRQFQIDQIPCPHTMAVCHLRQIPPYSYGSNYYTKESLYATYQDIVHPLGSSSGWDVPEEISSRIVEPPMTKCKPGRPKMKMILSQDEETQTIRSSRCEQYGHNRKTCSNPIPLCSYQASHSTVFERTASSNTVS